MANASYEKVLVWQRSIELVEFVYRLTREFPADEKSGLAATLRRTVTGIPAKIADALGQDDNDKAAQTLSGVGGTIREMQTYVYICRRMRFLGYMNYVSLRRKLRKIDLMLEKRIDRLQAEEPDLEPVVKVKRPTVRRAA